MNHLVGRILSVGIALAAAVTLHAQNKSITADVPFNFYVGSTVMPQGAYRIDAIQSGAVCLQAKESDAYKSITTVKVTGKLESEPPRLVFHRYGNVYFLAQIWTGDRPTGQALVKTKREKEIAQNHTFPTLAVIQLALPR